MKELFINENNGYSHLVMEYITLPNLESQLPRFVGNERLTRDLIINLLNSVSYMHRCGVCHRDLKPDNIMVSINETESGMHLNRAVIIDLGVSKRFKTTAPGLRTPKLVDMWTATGT